MSRSDHSPAPAVAMAAFVALGAVILARMAQGFPNLFFEDDAYFYMQIAWNLGTGAGSTFDGIHATNGYHLLWVGLLVPFATLTSLLGLGKVAFTGVVAGIGLALAGVSVMTAFRGTAERCLAMLFFLFCGITMEGVLLTSILLIGARMFTGEIRGRTILTLELAAAASMTRVDFALVFPALALLAHGDRRTARGIPLWPAVAGALLGIGLHLACERWFFGTWSSVSAAYKLDRAIHEGGLPLLRSNLENKANVLRYAMLVGLSALAATRWIRDRKVRELGAVVIALGPIVVYSLWSDMRDWYFLTGLLLALFLASRAVADRPRTLRIAAVCMSLILGLAFTGYLARAAGDMKRTANFVAGANRILHPTDVVFQVDGSGFTGWWLKAHVVNGDGLMNTWDYRRRQLAGQLHGYLDEIQATYVVTNAEPLPEPLLAWHGILVRREDVRPAVETEPTRNPLVRFRLFALPAR